MCFQNCFNSHEWSILIKAFFDVIRVQFPRLTQATILYLEMWLVDKGGMDFDWLVTISRIFQISRHFLLNIRFSFLSDAFVKKQLGKYEFKVMFQANL